MKQYNEGHGDRALKEEQEIIFEKIPPRPHEEGERNSVPDRGQRAAPLGRRREWEGTRREGRRHRERHLTGFLLSSRLGESSDSGRDRRSPIRVGIPPHVTKDYNTPILTFRKGAIEVNMSETIWV